MNAKHDQRIHALKAEVDRLSKEMHAADDAHQTARMCWRLAGQMEGPEFQTLCAAYWERTRLDMQLKSAQDLLHAARMARLKK